MTPAPYLKQSNHQNNSKHIINNVNISIQGIWNSWEHSETKEQRRHD